MKSHLTKARLSRPVAVLSLLAAVVATLAAFPQILASAAPATDRTAARAITSYGIWSDSTVHAAVVDRPEAEPRYRDTRPSSVWPLSYSGAATRRSENPSPLTSPAVATDFPYSALSELLSIIHAGFVVIGSIVIG